MTTAKLYGLAEISDATNVPLGVLYVWRSRGKIPAPDFELRMGPVWTTKTIGPFIRKHRKEGRT